MQTGTRCSCRLCGSREVELDEVLDAGLLRLAVCGRCGQRWTERPLLAVAPPLGASEWEQLVAA
jgi:hypothetical protein